MEYSLYNITHKLWFNTKRNAITKVFNRDFRDFSSITNIIVILSKTM